MAKKATVKKPTEPAKQGQGVPKSDNPTLKAELTQAAQVFEEKLKLCPPQERLFVSAKLEGRNNRDAAISAQYSPATAAAQGARLLTRARVADAIQAGWAAKGFGPESILASVSEMLDFDPGEVTSYINEVVIDRIERLASEVLEDVQQELLLTRQFRDDLKMEDVGEDELKPINAQLRQLRKRELALMVIIAKDAEATCFVEVERLKRVPYVDLEKVQESGKMKFVTGIKSTRYGRDIEVLSRKDIVEIAGRATGIFREGVELSAKDGEALVVPTVIVLPNNGRDAS